MKQKEHLRRRNPKGQKTLVKSERERYVHYINVRGLAETTHTGQKHCMMMYLRSKLKIRNAM